MTNRIHQQMKCVDSLFFWRICLRFHEGLVQKVNCSNAMGRAHVGVSIPIQFTSWNVATGAHAFGRDLFALGALVLLVGVALENVLSLKLHGALRALPRLLVSMHLLQVVGKLKVCFEFDLADLARNFVGLARRNVHVLVVRGPLLEDLPTISAH